MLPAVASAALVAYDGFEYNIGGGAGLAGKGSAANGWEGAWSGSGTIVADNMSYTAGTIAINGGSQSLSITGSSQAYFTRQFETIGNTPGAGESIYFSFLFKAVSGAPADYLNLWISDDADRANSAGIGDVTASNRFGVRIFDDNTSTNNSTQSSATYTFGEGDVYLLVGRISTDGASGAAGVYDQIELWVNPTSTILGTPTHSSDISTLVGDSVGFSFVGLQTANISGTDDYRIDEFRIGISAAGVLTVIPEPSSAATLLGGLAMLIFMGRRARR